MGFQFSSAVSLLGQENVFYGILVDLLTTK